MATQAQVQANRLNAQKSTGPRTDEGKAIASQNAVKHGLCAETAVIAGEDVGEFEFYRDELLGELTPAGAVESMVAERVVSLSWRLRRAERAQNEAFDTLLARVATDPFRRNARAAEADGLQETLLGRAVVRDFANGRVLDRLSMYERRIEYSLYKSMNELERLRLVRELEPGAEKPRWANERWGKPQPANATDQAAAGGGSAGGSEGSGETKPMAGEAAGAACREHVGGDAERSQSAEAGPGAPASREWGPWACGGGSTGREGDCAKRTQSSPARRGDKRQDEPIAAEG
ncbi:MAG: hypothetical protein JW741_16845 [Sedimentisphaerales bacterium]|nr:hypothetical protein [Sedimentisphaerales bacterium]